jgi:hypothetical protein
MGTVPGTFLILFFTKLLMLSPRLSRHLGIRADEGRGRYNSGIFLPGCNELVGAGFTSLCGKCESEGASPHFAW